MPVVIFDMDGVLIDSEPFHMEEEQRIFTQLGIEVSPQAHEQFVGMAPLMMWARLREQYRLPQSAEELKAMEIAHKVGQMKIADLQPIPGIPALIAQLQDAGHTLALASSAPRAYIDVITEKTGLRNAFRELVSGDDVRAGKPEPDIFLRTAALLGVNPVSCTVLEDSSNGVRAALAAGMRCIAYRNPHSGHQDISRAELIVDDFSPASINRILALWI